MTADSTLADKRSKQPLSPIAAKDGYFPFAGIGMLNGNGGRLSPITLASAMRPT
jgi:hypothetical protein